MKTTLHGFFIAILFAFISVGGAHAQSWTASTQFSSVQGQNQWYYQQRPVGGGAVTNMVWINTGGYSSIHGSTGFYQTSDTTGWLYWTDTHPGSVSDTIRKWVAPSTGTVSITGRVYKIATAVGAGVIGSVEKNGTAIWSKTLAYNDNVGYSTNTDLSNISVGSGDSIAFIVDNNGAYNADQTGWDPTLSYAGTPVVPVIWESSAVDVDASSDGSWMRCAHLQDGSWLAAHKTFSVSPPGIRISRSTDDMRTWSDIQVIQDSGRGLDNANLCQLSNGKILLSVESEDDGVSYRVETYSASSYNGTFSLLSIIDQNLNGSNFLGLWEPFLYQLPNGNILAFYSDETHRGSPSYNQLIGERVSTDGGATWGSEIFAMATGDGTSRPGEPYFVQMANGTYLLSAECPGCSPSEGHYKTSSDGVSWSAGVGTGLSGTGGRMIIQSFPNGLLLATSDNYSLYYSLNYGSTWTSQTPAYTSGDFIAFSFYQTAPHEVAAVQGLHIEFGSM